VRRLGLILGTAVVLVVVLFSVWIISRPERGTTGSVNTKFRLLGPDDKIVVDGFDDPKVDGVACHISRAQIGGMKGAFGVAEDTSDASIACRQIGPIKIKAKSRMVSVSSTSAAACCSRRFGSRDSSTSSATFWSMWPTATGSSKAAQRTASALFQS
jgi:hypothetical protein